MADDAEREATTRGPGGFHWSEQAEPHRARRKEMLAAHPEIKQLYGPCPRTKYVCLAFIGAQLLLAYSVRDAPLWLLFVVAYFVGGTLNHSLLLAIHELSHNLAFKKPLANRFFALVVNLPIGLPVAAAFREYHLMHHTHQGVDGVDTDIPTVWEARWVRSRPAKLVWLFAQGLAYALRPLFVMPLKPSGWVLLNAAVQIAFDVVIYHFWGLQALLYLPLGTLLAMGLHPMAGHFVSEHYVMTPGQETYSYYGPLNLLAFNVGYHNEHHDFPYIAGSRLPLLRRAASSYYDGLTVHRSWSKVLWDYFWRKDLGATSRVKRRA